MVSNYSTRLYTHGKKKLFTDMNFSIRGMLKMDVHEVPIKRRRQGADISEILGWFLTVVSGSGIRTWFVEVISDNGF